MAWLFPVLTNNSQKFPLKTSSGWRSPHTRFVSCRRLCGAMQIGTQISFSTQAAWSCHPSLYSDPHRIHSHHDPLSFEGIIILIEAIIRGMIPLSRFWRMICTPLSGCWRQFFSGTQRCEADSGLASMATGLRWILCYLCRCIPAYQSRSTPSSKP